MQRQPYPISKLVLCICLVWSGTMPAATTGNTFGNILRGMATGLALLGQATNNQTPNYASPVIPVYPLPPGYAWPGAPAWGAPPWTGGYGYPGYPYNGNHPQARSRQSTLRRLQGSWETSNGGLLLIKENLARLYVSADRHQDLYIRADRHYVWMWPVDSQAVKRYDHRIFDDKILLRDEQGNTLTLKRYRPKSTRP